MLPLIVVSYVVGLGIEFAFAQFRGHEVNEGFLVSGLLIPMIMPVDMPLWMVALATAFAVVFGKEVFGGTGMNVFNPALLARAFAFFAYTPSMSGATVWIAGMTSGEGVVDGFSGATALEQPEHHGRRWAIRTMDAFLGFIPGCVGETSTLAILIGAAILLFTGVASWRTMLSVFAGGLADGPVSSNALGVNATAYSGMVAPDRRRFRFRCRLHGHRSASPRRRPTRANTSSGLMTGALAVLIRVVNPAYPEGMMLSILFMNALAPLVDYYVVEANISRRKNRVKLAK